MAQLRDGSAVEIRPIEPEDKPLLVAGLERLGPDSRYSRFFTPVNRFTDGQLKYLTEIDHERHEALIALDPAGEIVGVARYVAAADRERTAEVAVTVIDDWQGRGLASVLLGELVIRALECGIDRFAATTLSSNTDAIDVLERLGATTRAPGGDGVVELDIDISPSRVDALFAMLREAAQGVLDFRFGRDLRGSDDGEGA